MKRTIRVASSALVLIAGAAHGTPVVSGDATLDLLHAPPALPIFSGNLGNGSLVTDPGVADQLYMFNWYYRTPFDATNRPFSSLVTPTVSVSGSTMTVTYLDNGSGPVGQNRFDAVFEITVTDGGVPGVTTVATRLTFTARAANTATRTFQVMNITDLDLIGGEPNQGLDDRAELVDAALRKVSHTDPTGNSATLTGTSAAFTEVNTGAALRAKMASPGSNFAQVAGPVEGDVGVGSQWTLTLAPGQSQVIESEFQIGLVPAPACPGDVNGDTLTNAADFTVMAAHYGQTVPVGTLGDLNGTGTVDSADFTILAGDFGCVP